MAPRVLRRGAFDLAQLVGAMDEAHQREVHDLALRVRAMLVALLRR